MIAAHVDALMQATACSQLAEIRLIVQRVGRPS
jgi:hypothetical protein